MANFITISRIFLLVIFGILLYTPGILSKIVAAVLIIILFIMDAVDGYVARRLNETNQLGSVLDIMADRLVETVLWILFYSVGLLPLWVPLVIISRGIIVDSLRSAALSEGETAFGMMRTTWGKRIVSSKFTRSLYGASKGVVFTSLTLLIALDALLKKTSYYYIYAWAEKTVFAMVVFVVGLCVLRGLPVVFETQRFFHKK